MITHTSIVHGKCPINGNWDYYDVTITTPEFVAVESIEVVLNAVRGSGFTQEVMCEKIKSLLPASCNVRLAGMHSQNTKTTVEA